MLYIDGQLASIQSAGKRRCDLEPTLLGKVYGRIDIALPARQLHALDVLKHLTIFKAFIFGQVFIRTVFARG
jgi:hypothetical protein